tara:strand:- start:1031 stop:1975 length:945 start_codon:yes stop_codon:yes gene_type:complete
MKISLIVPYYNEEKNILYTLNQILNQSYKPSEIIFINSNSNDNSSLIVNNFIKDNRLNLLNYDTKAKSASEAKNIGIKYSKSEWLAFMDCDMAFQKDWLKMQVSFALNHPHKKIIFGNTLLEGTNIIDKCCIINTYGLGKINPTIPSSLVKKSVFNITSNLFISASSHYDSYWIKKNLQENFSIINKKSIITYLGTNYSSSYFGLFKKSFYYSSSLKDVYSSKAYFFLILILIVLLSFFFVPVISLYILAIYVLSRLVFIPVIKNKNLKFYKIIKFKIFTLLFVSFLLDIGRITGILLSLFINKNKKIFKHYKN